MKLCHEGEVVAAMRRVVKESTRIESNEPWGGSANVYFSLKHCLQLIFMSKARGYGIVYY